MDPIVVLGTKLQPDETWVSFLKTQPFFRGEVLSLPMNFYNALPVVAMCESSLTLVDKKDWLMDDLAGDATVQSFGVKLVKQPPTDFLVEKERYICIICNELHLMAKSLALRILQNVMAGVRKGGILYFTTLSNLDWRFEGLYPVQGEEDTFHNVNAMSCACGAVMVCAFNLREVIELLQKKFEIIEAVEEFDGNERLMIQVIAERK